jgi:hypothetical protein
VPKQLFDLKTVEYSTYQLAFEKWWESLNHIWLTLFDVIIILLFLLQKIQLFKLSMWL